MGTAKMGPLIFSMALPAMISMIINALYNSRNQLAHHRILPYSELKQLHQQLL